MNILFYQHGDFAEAFRRFQAGEPETYRDQKRSVDFVAGLSRTHRVVTMARGSRPHEERLGENLLSIGIDKAMARNRHDLSALLTRLAPDRIICRSPNIALLSWARRHRVPCLPIFADIFANTGVRQVFRNLQLRALLGAPVFPCVANHSLNASRSVARALFYPAGRIIPWDWARLSVQPDPKPFPSAGLSVFFAGLLSARKGLGDCLEALALLARQGLDVRFTFAGPGDQAPWQARAEALGVADRVSFSGRIAHEAVQAHMRSCDVVVVPSRHDYAEGLPNTIYEALAARSPLVISDHPAFAGRLRPDQECLVFKAADPQSLAGQLGRLARDPALFARLSQAAAAAHDRLYIGSEWSSLITDFLADPDNQTGWVNRQSLACLQAAGLLPGQNRVTEGTA